MGLYTHINISFSASSEDSPHAEAFINNDNPREVNDMLGAFFEGKGFFSGRKGELFNWGYVGNYTDPELFVESITPFLEHLRSNDTSFLDFEHALVFYEREQFGYCDCYEIKPEDAADSKLIVVEHKELPFCWNQF